MFGPPGAGKGTQSAFLVEDLKMAHISTGDLFRYNMKNDTPLGREAKEYMDAGKYVPDDVTIRMLKDAMSKLDGQEFILDGFPRTLPQAEALDELMKESGQEIGGAFFLEVPEEQLVGRLSGRRLCKSCGAVYHVDTKPPADGKTCDNCGSEDIYQRTDDQPDAIRERLSVYAEKTLPLKNFYKEQGKVTELDGTGELTDVYERLKAVVTA